MADKAQAGYYEGIPPNLTPELAEWMKANDPHYELRRPVIEVRLAAWYKAHDPKYKPEDRERHQLLLKISNGEEPMMALTAYDAKKKAEDAEKAAEEAGETEAVRMVVPVSSVIPLATPASSGLGVSPPIEVEIVDVSSEAAVDVAEEKEGPANKAGRRDAEGGSK